MDCFYEINLWRMIILSQNKSDFYPRLSRVLYHLLALNDMLLLRDPKVLNVFALWATISISQVLSCLLNMCYLNNKLRFVSLTIR